MTDTSQPQPRRPSDPRLVQVLNERLDEKARVIRRLEDSECALAAMLQDLEAEIAGLRAELDQVKAALEEKASKKVQT